MGYDCGFDVHPRLEATASNKEAYRRFIEETIHTYEIVYDPDGRRDDGKVLVLPEDSEDSDGMYIVFMVGEGPSFPSNPEHCNYFLRFNSKVSGNLTLCARSYIDDVFRIAKEHFGRRVRYWHNLSETDDERQWGYYDWSEIHDADDKLRALNTVQT